ncbi:VOC family protein [Pandoraea fibrosis]|uniref:VOC family protein n=1 Tax=Pandoraea fibrosis TaxID=1891094 RepID=A0ABX6HWF7_9BURK|nr:VOC family protein [Pandoraea fibrosis]QHE91619.1 VOC family protein [Pandoraea fibrosis]QHF14823.1 VOC family protein [Pandoraea fibrosis]
MAKLRHIALAVPNPAETAKFYCETFGMTIAGQTDSPLASGVYLTDGTVCLALLNYKNDASAGLDKGKDFVGFHHIGFWCDDLDAQSGAITQNGGEFFMDLPIDKTSLYYEKKFRDPLGNVFDISHNGWVGARK